MLVGIFLDCGGWNCVVMLFVVSDWVGGIFVELLGWIGLLWVWF